MGDALFTPSPDFGKGPHRLAAILFMSYKTRKRLGRRRRRLDGDEGIDVVRCRICGDHRRVISGRLLSKHDTDRETYMEEYDLTPDELITKDFRAIQSSRRGFYPHGKNDWIDAVKKLRKQGESISAGDLQDNYPYLYNQGVWILAIGTRLYAQRDSILKVC